MMTLYLWLSLAAKPVVLEVEAQACHAAVLLIFAAVLQKYGVRIPQLPTISATELAWLCGAIWLARGGRIA